MNNTENNLCKGRVSAIYKNSYVIRFEGKDISARLKGTFQEKAPEFFPVVGDYVSFVNNPIGDSLIVAVEDRTSFLQRPDQAKTGVMQYMVANVDYTLIVTSLNQICAATTADMFVKWRASLIKSEFMLFRLYME